MHDASPTDVPPNFITRKGLFIFQVQVRIESGVLAEIGKLRFEEATRKYQASVQGWQRLKNYTPSVDF
jgi:hypothetical protein